MSLPYLFEPGGVTVSRQGQFIAIEVPRNYSKPASYTKRRVSVVVSLLYMSGLLRVNGKVVALCGECRKSFLELSLEKKEA
eukprot:5637760-Amphidinium_carterae.1